MSKWIVWSKPAPLPVLLKAAALAIIVGVALVFLVKWIGIGYGLGRFVALLGAGLAGMGYVNTHRPAPPNQEKTS